MIYPIILRVTADILGHLISGFSRYRDILDVPMPWYLPRCFPRSGTSGNPRKFRHGIYLVYTWYILLAFVILVYTRYMTGIWFLEKSIFVYYRMHVCMQWLLPKYTIHRALDGDLFSISYIELNISMVYDRHLLAILLIYTTFSLFWFWVSKCIEKKYKPITTT
jgi:hypothetical protein